MAEAGSWPRIVLLGLACLPLAAGANAGASGHGSLEPPHVEAKAKGPGTARLMRAESAGEHLAVHANASEIQASGEVLQAHAQAQLSTAHEKAQAPPTPRPMPIAWPLNGTYSCRAQDNYGQANARYQLNFSKSGSLTGSAVDLDGSAGTCTLRGKWGREGVIRWEETWSGNLGVVRANGSLSFGFGKYTDVLVVYGDNTGDLRGFANLSTVVPDRVPLIDIKGRILMTVEDPEAIIRAERSKSALVSALASMSGAWDGCIDVNISMLGSTTSFPSLLEDGTRLESASGTGVLDVVFRIDLLLGGVTEHDGWRMIQILTNKTTETLKYQVIRALSAKDLVYTVSALTLTVSQPWLKRDKVQATTTNTTTTTLTTATTASGTSVQSAVKVVAAGAPSPPSTTKLVKLEMTTTAAGATTQAPKTTTTTKLIVARDAAATPRSLRSLMALAALALASNLRPWASA